jgi:hypothetical protein
LEEEDFQNVLRATGGTETKQENIQDWLQLDDGKPWISAIFFYQFLHIGSTVIFLYFFTSVLPILLTFQFICFLIFIFF